jgi:hypothetical protein
LGQSGGSGSDVFTYVRIYADKSEKSCSNAKRLNSQDLQRDFCRPMYKSYESYDNSTNSHLPFEPNTKTGVSAEDLLRITAFFNFGMAFDKAQWYVR